MRLAPILAALTLLALAPAALALDTGSGLASIGGTASVTGSLNKSLDTINATPGFRPNLTAGRGVPEMNRGKTNPTQSGSFALNNQAIQLAGGKGYSTQLTVPGRNDPMPILAGRRHRDNYGGLSQ